MTTKTKKVNIDTDLIELNSAYEYRAAYNINSIEDCVNVAEEVAAGYQTEDTLSSLKTISTKDQAELGHDQINRVDGYFDNVFYSGRLKDGRCYLINTNKSVKSTLNN